MSEKEGLTIVELRAENIKRLRAVHLRPAPGGGLVILRGANEAGKTSALDSIWYALGGAKAVPGEPVRRGEKEARAEVTLRGPDNATFTVTRTFTAAGGGSLTVQGKDGAEFRSPQKLLDSFLGALTFDPLSFTRLKPQEQRDILLQCVNVGLDLDANARDRQVLYDERTAFGRRLRDVEGALTTYVSDEVTEAPEKPVETDNLTRELSATQSSLGELDRLSRCLAIAEHEQRRLEDVLARYKDEAATFRQELAELDKDALDERRQDLESALGKAAAQNVLVGRKQEYLRQRASRDDLAREVAEHTVRIVALDKARSDVLAAAKFPYPGLSVSQEGVVLDGLPFGQMSASRQLKASLGIAMALNPRLRVIRMEEGVRLDADSLKAVQEMAAARGYQIWIERVTDDGLPSILIEDGAVKEPTGGYFFVGNSEMGADEQAAEFLAAVAKRAGATQTEAAEGGFGAGGVECVGRVEGTATCAVCGQELGIDGGWQGTGLCGPCATGEHDSAGERGETW